MSHLVIFYSYSGSTKGIAEDYAKKEAADVYEIRDTKRPGKFKAYTAGVIASIRGKAWTIVTPDIDLASFDRITLFAPVWAGNPPPAFNAMLELLPSDKNISIKLVSASGKSECREKLDIFMKNKGSTLESFEDIKRG